MCAFKSTVIKIVKGKALPVQAQIGLPRLQELKLPGFSYNRHMKVKTSAVRTGRLFRQGRFMVLISVRGWADHRDIVQPKALGQWKISKTPSGIETATFRLGTQCLNELPYRVLPIQIFLYLIKSEVAETHTIKIFIQWLVCRRQRDFVCLLHFECECRFFFLDLFHKLLFWTATIVARQFHFLINENVNPLYSSRHL